MSFEYDIDLEGFQSIETGERYIYVINDNLGSAIIPRGAFSGNGGEALRMLKNAGLEIVGTKECTLFVNKVAGITKFEQVHIAGKVGWNGPLFVLPNGELIRPSGTEEPYSAVLELRRKCEQSGTLADWKKLICEPVIEHPVLSFFIMSMFAASILRFTPFFGNLAFELCGAKGVGKSAVQRLMAGVAGGTGQGAEGHYWSMFDATMNSLEDIMAAHSDCPIILDEANLFSEELPPRILATRFKMLAFKLRSGTTKNRKGDPGGDEHRALSVISTNTPLASLIGEDTDSATAAADRLLTIALPKSRPHGTLECIPDGFRSEAEFVDKLLENAACVYGVAFPAFIQTLGDDRATSESTLRATIAEHMAEFREHAGVVEAKGSPLRVANAFAIVYAAGCLAREYEVLPDNFWCGRSALTCYRLHLNRGSAGHSFRERVGALAKSDDVVDIGSGRLRELTKKEYDHGIFLRDGREGAELLIRADRINNFFDDWSAIKGRDEVCSQMNSEKGRRKIRRKLSADHDKVRVYSFKVA